MSTPIVEKVIELVNQLSPEDRHRVAEHIHTLESEETEEEWEERVLTQALGDALRPDGTIDYSKISLVSPSFEELEADLPDELTEDE